MLVAQKDQRRSYEKARLNREEIQEVDKFNYLKVMMSMEGGIGRKWLIGFSTEGRNGGRCQNWGENMLSREVKRELYERVVVQTVVYGSETWSLSAQERRKQKYLRRCV